MGVFWRVVGTLSYADATAVDRALGSFRRVEVDGFVEEKHLRRAGVDLVIDIEVATTLAHGLEAGPAFVALARKAERGWVDRICVDHQIAERVLAGGKARTIRPDPPLGERHGGWWSALRHIGPIYAFAASGDGRHVAIGGGTTSPDRRDADVLVWQEGQPTPTARLAGLNHGITAIAFSRDGGAVAALSQTGTGAIWEVASGKKIGRLKARRNRRTLLLPQDEGFLVHEPRLLGAVSSDGMHYALQEDVFRLRVHRCDGGEAVASLDLLARGLSAPRALALGVDATLYAVAEGRVFAWDWATGALRTTELDAKPWRALVVVPGARQLAGIQQGADAVGAVPLPDERWKPPREVAAPLRISIVDDEDGWVASLVHDARIEAAACSYDGRRIALGGGALRDGRAEVVVWERGQASPLARLVGLRKGIEQLCFDRSGEALAAVSVTGTGAIWDLATQKRVGRLRARRRHPFLILPEPGGFAVLQPTSRAAAVSPQGAHYAVLQGTHVGVFRTDDRTTVATLDLLARRLTIPKQVALGPDGRLYSLFDDHVDSWDWESEDLRRVPMTPRFVRHALVVPGASRLFGVDGLMSKLIALPMPTAPPPAPVPWIERWLAEHAELDVASHDASGEDWTWNRTADRHDGVCLSEGDRLHWYTHTNNPHAGGGGATQPVDDFLANGPRGRPPPDVLAALVAAVLARTGRPTTVPRDT